MLAGACLNLYEHSVAAPALDVTLREVRRMMRRGDIQAAHTKLDALVIDPRSVAPTSAGELARVYLKLGRWDDALGLGASEPATNLVPFLTYARNMRVLERCHPSAAQAMLAHPPSPRWGVDEAYQVVRNAPNGTAVRMHGDPEAAVTAALELVSRAFAERGVVGCRGVGDGHALMGVARSGWEGPNRWIFPVLVVEPDLDLLRLVFEMHDFTGSEGPLEQTRVRWFVGPTWAEDLRACVLDAAELPFPADFVPNAFATEHRATLKAIGEACVQDAWRLLAELNAHYDKQSPKIVAAIMRQNSDRAPRMMIVTSRYTTVLERTAFAAQQTLRDLGWDCEVLTDKADHVPLHSLSCLRSLAQYKPDACMIPDHFRLEYNGRYPAKLPFVTWLQDLMPLASTSDTGRAMTPYDVVISHFPAIVEHFDFPSRQVLLTNAMASERAVSSISESAYRYDMVYMSHASYTESELRQRTLEWATHVSLPSDPVEAAFDDLVAIYRGGGSLATSYDLLKWLAEHFSFDVSDARVGHLYGNTFGFAHATLHRQQGLRWACDVAEEQGLRLAVYGEGWHKQPWCRAWARGPVAPGTAAMDVVDHARTVLVLEPWAVTKHWRGLDGLFAERLPLVRRNPWHRLPARLANVLMQAGLLHCETLEQAQREVGQRFREELHACTANFYQLGLLEDPIAWHCRTQQSTKFDGVFPQGIEDCSFENKEQLSERVLWSIAEPKARAHHAQALAQAVRVAFSYRTGFRRVACFLADYMTAIAEGP